MTNGRLHNHQAVSGSDINGLTHPAQSLRRAQKPRCEPLRESPAFTLRSAVTVTVPAEAVGLRTKRLSHHRVMSGNVWDGCKPVRRSYHGRYSRIPHSERSRRGANVTETRYVYQVYGTTERVSSTVLIASIRVVVVGIGNPAQNDVSGPRHARGTLKHAIYMCSLKLRPRAQ